MPHQNGSSRVQDDNKQQDKCSLVVQKIHRIQRVYTSTEQPSFLYADAIRAMMI
jgi:hypothetical protein